MKEDEMREAAPISAVPRALRGGVPLAAALARALPLPMKLALALPAADRWRGRLELPLHRRLPPAADAAEALALAAPSTAARCALAPPAPLRFCPCRCCAAGARYLSRCLADAAGACRCPMTMPPDYASAAGYAPAACLCRCPLPCSCRWSGRSYPLPAAPEDAAAVLTIN
eukprot:gene3562-13634_t